MSKEVFGLDFDDLLVHTAEFVLTEHNREYGTLLGLDDYYKDNFVEAWGVPKEVAVQRVARYLSSDECLALPPSQEAVEVTSQASEEYELVVLTGRTDALRTATHHWVDAHMPGVFADIIFTNYYGDDHGAKTKGDYCIEAGLVGLGDDHAGHVNSAAQAGVGAYLFEGFPWSQGVLLHPVVKVVSGWEQFGKAILAHV